MSENDEGAAGVDRAASIRAGITLLWDGLIDGGRGPKRSLTLPQILDAVIARADADGLEALSMRSIARELGIGTMTLYRYVPDKAALLDLVLDHLVTPGEVWQREELPGVGPQWRRALALTATEGRAIYLAHPWMLRVNWSRPTFGPNTIASLEVIVARLGELGLTGRETINLINALDGFVTGCVRAQITYDSATHETGLTEEEYWALQIPVLERAMETGNYPAIAALDEDSFDGAWDESFELGLTAFLDGVALRFDSPAQRRSTMRS